MLLEEHFAKYEAIPLIPKFREHPRHDVKQSVMQLGLKYGHEMLLWCAPKSVERVKWPHERNLYRSDVIALLCYTFDSGTEMHDNLYYQLHQMLHKRSSTAITTWKDYATIFLSALSKLPRYSGTIIRISNIDPKQYQVNKIFCWDFFASGLATNPKEITADFVGSAKTLFILQVENAADVSMVSCCPEQGKEVIVAANSKWQVKSVETSEKFPATIVTLQQIGFYVQLHSASAELVFSYSQTDWTQAYTDIWSVICRQLSIKDALQLRRTCKILLKIVNETVFKKKYFLHFFFQIYIFS